MARKLSGLRTSHRLKLVVTLLVGVIILFASHQVMLPPNLVPIAVLTTSVPAQTTIPASDVQWVATNHPPHSLLTQAQSDLLTTLVPNQGLAAGSSIPIATLVPPGAATTLNTGEIPWSVAVSGAASSYFTLGGRVSVWAPLGSSASPVLVAEGVRVIGMYNSAGSSVSPTPGNAATAPSSLSLAVPQADLETFLALQTPTVEPDSTSPRFVLDEGGTPAANVASSTPSSTPSTTAIPTTGSTVPPSSTPSTGATSSSGSTPSTHGAVPGSSGAVSSSRTHAAKHTAARRS